MIAVILTVGVIALVVMAAIGACLAPVVELEACKQVVSWMVRR